MNGEKWAKIWEDIVEYPTYEVGEPDKNPMFLEKRVYQGSSGKVYPLPVIDKITDQKKMKEYRVVYLENPYLKVMIMPELGGRIHRAFDKTNQYDFVYHNEVIKPALVGLVGPWISGGIEFNWPQHHRPNTFGPVEYQIEENEDGSKTLWVSEIDKMYGTKGMAGFTLYPDKAYIEITGQLYNRTELPQTFLWWANPAVAVNDHTQSIFPPDVHAVFDHGKRDVSKFPIATGIYYKMDYSEGVDISRYKNIPVPTSYMAYKSDYDFVGGYDYHVEAGILHIANHHISPGKKQWTWGCGDFGKAWDRNLTDDNGPYIELMTGVYTDNQPDFTWLKPHEEKTFKQYFMPYKKVGLVKNANIDVAVGLEKTEAGALITVYVTSHRPGLNIRLQTQKDSINKLDDIRLTSKPYHDVLVDLDPSEAYQVEVALPDGVLLDSLELVVISDQGDTLIHYAEKGIEQEPIPDAAKPMQLPKDIQTIEELYLAGLHLEQYRHATYEPEAYYEEGLKRDANDIRLNNAYGLLMLRRGLFKLAEHHFRLAVKRSTKHNPNPYDGEPFFNLGLALKYQGKLEEAYGAFYKSVWSSEWQGSGYYEIAKIDCINKQYANALEHVQKSLVKNSHHMKARHLEIMVLRKLGKVELAVQGCELLKTIDKLDTGALSELFFLGIEQAKERLGEILRGDLNNLICLAAAYGESGANDEAIELLNLGTTLYGIKSPMVHYYQGYYALMRDTICTEDLNLANKYFEEASHMNFDYCFPNTLEDLLVLEKVIKTNPEDAYAHLILGNLLYDKKQYEQALKMWHISVKLNSDLAIAHRNLALGYYNKLGQADLALKHLSRAVAIKPDDARLVLELDQLHKKMNKPYHERLAFLKERIKVVEKRDDLYVEYITLLNMDGQYDLVCKLIESRIFHPWEGGEGKITKQFVIAHLELAKKELVNNNPHIAIEHLCKTFEYPKNLGEGKLYGTQENNIHYYLACAYEMVGDSENAQIYFEKASKGLSEPTSAMFYNDQPPEMIYYQGLAHLKLNQIREAKARFNKLISYGETHFYDSVKIDYFAISLPDFLIFDDDLDLKNRIHCHYLMALGYLGLGEKVKALGHFKEGLLLEGNHQGIVGHLRELEDII